MIPKRLLGILIGSGIGGVAGLLFNIAYGKTVSLTWTIGCNPYLSVLYGAVIGAVGGLILASGLSRR